MRSITDAYMPAVKIYMSSVYELSYKYENDKEEKRFLDEVIFDNYPEDDNKFVGLIPIDEKNLDFFEPMEDELSRGNFAQVRIMTDFESDELEWVIKMPLGDNGDKSSDFYKVLHDYVINNLTSESVKKLYGDGLKTEYFTKYRVMIRDEQSIKVLQLYTWNGVEKELSRLKKEGLLKAGEASQLYNYGYYSLF